MRKGIHLEIKGLQTPRERLWDAILVLKKFTGTELQDKALPLVEMRTMQIHLNAWVLSGHLKRVNAKNAKPGKLQDVVLQLVKPQGLAPRVNRKGEVVTQGSINDALWRAMKILSSFNCCELAQAATLGEFVVKPATAQRYISHLARAGYLHCAGNQAKGVLTRHRLVNNTGMHAPAVTTLKAVFDRNTGSFAHLPSVQEVCDAQVE
jgi:hypothetical protein